MLKPNKIACPRGTDEAKVIKVIETKSIRGQGTQDDLGRQVIQYWDYEGNLLAESNPVDSILSEHGDHQENISPCGWHELKEDKKLKIKFNVRFNSVLHLLPKFFESVIDPLQEKYPDAEIEIEIST